jgi:exopolysaccharide production protein ExoY
LRTRQRSELIEKKVLDYGAYAAILPSQSQKTSGEPSIRRELEALTVGRRSARAAHPQFRVIDHGGALATGLLDTSGRSLHAGPARPIRGVVKRVLDVLGVVSLGLIFAPLIVAIAILLRREGGAIIFRHRRIGRDGKPFDCLKFRSMVPDADRALRDLLERHPEFKAEWLRDHKLRNDPRITGVGHFLRRTSLDELPQLWNVLRGEMSLVGPRPVVREELLRYGRCAGIYLSARPGITGLWQVKGRTNTDYRQRVVLDVYYVRRHNLFLDLYILVKTTHVVLGGSGAY